jgi:DNA polymerase III epsilon subunit-like protein
MLESQPREECLVSVDVETAGPNPHDYALLSIGACLVNAPEVQFFCELQPTTERMDSQAFSIHGLSLDELKLRGLPPKQAMADFEQWLLQAAPVGTLPVFVGFNAAFDWMFVADYFNRYLGRNPFGHAALDVKSYYMGAYGVPFLATSRKHLAARFPSAEILQHHALQDALDQASLFRQVLSDLAREP